MENLLTKPTTADIIATLDDTFGNMADTSARAVILDRKISYVKKRLDRYLGLARRYNMPEYHAEVIRLMERLHTLRRLSRA